MNFKLSNLSDENRSNIFVHHGRCLLRDHLNDSASRDDPQPNTPRTKHDVVGILGAGVGGLYTALMLQSIGIPCQILEASERVGGRLYTHHFKKGGEFDYYDVGAMRFPLPKREDHHYGPGVMKRLGDLFIYLDMEDRLVPYYFEAKPTGEPGFMYFNGVRCRIGDNVDFRPKEVGVGKKFGDYHEIVQDVVWPFARMLVGDVESEEDIHNGWRVMMRNDGYSTRGYMMFKYLPNASFDLQPDHLTTREINWLETFDKSTGWYNRAFTETVLEEIAFGTGQKVDWRCIKGGSEVLPQKMADRLRYDNKTEVAPILMGKSVTSIKSKKSTMVVTADGEDIEYSHVISTLPIPVLRTIDLSGCNMRLRQTNALRELSYGPSIKIGILFSEPWWTTGQDINGTPLNITGGQSFTDLPVRTIVYPSYGVDSCHPSNTLIASYCWTNDAERMSSLFTNGQPNAKLEKLVLNNLAVVHNVSYEYLKRLFVEMHPWSWGQDPLTMGAFAFFGPGDFSQPYTSLTRSAAHNRLFFAGEALSVRHAWVVGALDSAWRAVYSYLLAADQDKIDEFTSKWGFIDEWYGSDKGVQQSERPNLLEKHLRTTHH